MMRKLYEEASFRKIATIKDGYTFDSGYISIAPCDGGVELVIGALWESRFRSAFSKRGLEKLIEQLQVVHSIMKD
jgi:hypothetical protein